jgi:hypothetical protein
MIVFRSQATADIMMFDDIARRMMELMGKEPADRGIVTVEQLPDAIARLKAAIADDHARHRGEQEEERPQSESTPGGARRAYVALAQRAVPLVQMLEYSLQADKPVMWGI